MAEVFHTVQTFSDSLRLSCPNEVFSDKVGKVWKDA